MISILLREETGQQAKAVTVSKQVDDIIAQGIITSFDNMNEICFYYCNYYADHKYDKV